MEKLVIFMWFLPKLRAFCAVFRNKTTPEMTKKDFEGSIL